MTSVSGSCAWPLLIREIGVANIAHRGASAYAPENTLPAFEMGFAMAAHAVEFDVRLTRDGVPVVIHDGSVQRTTDGEGSVGELSLEEIKTLDAGGWFSDAYRGARVPTLAETLDELPAEALVNIEIKGGIDEHPGIEDKVLALVDAAEIGPRVVISSYDIETIRRISSRSRVCGTSLRIRPLPGGELDMDRLVGVCLCVNLELTAVNPQTVEQLHEAGYVVEVFTVNDEEEMRRLVKMGVDAIFTNRPDLLARALRDELGAVG